MRKCYFRALAALAGGAVLSGCLLLSGCAAPPPPAFDGVSQTLSRRLDQTVAWRGVSESDQAADDAMHRLLSAPLTADTAVQVSLLDNRDLQATYEDLGIARADLVQAGLLKNPIFSFDLRIPDVSPKKTYLDFSIEDDFVDLLLRPLREEMAEDAFAATKAHVVGQVLQLAAETRTAFYAYEAAQQQVEIAQRAGAAQAAALDVENRLHDAGNTSELNLLTQESMANQCHVDLLDAQAAQATARENLNQLMGLSGDDIQWNVTDRLADPPVDEIDGHGLETLAVQRNADVESARAAVTAAAGTLGITQKTSWFASIDAGANAERETDGQWRIGPSLIVPVPLFDQGQAAVAKAIALYRQSEQRYLAAVIDVQSRVRLALDQMQRARARALFYRDQQLPLQQKLVEQMQLEFNGMYVGIFELLSTKRDAIDTGREYIDSLRDYWTARAALELAIGGRVPAATTQPSQAGAD
jgi:outer membrane protein, heavy metal efflux system